ncbi:hypothetical protein CBW24_05265 [Pacificitalea manganoxidans]|uniref:Uncharacterized protein n=1 Tax=Pacificitalea manganoxidans TaxID=1411902 RepID=A0A291LXJ7_9RHOB|nr:hypothetical protein CBW24_05265 [Pacificitalea manganoxidans]
MSLPVGWRWDGGTARFIPATFLFDQTSARGGKAPARRGGQALALALRLFESGCKEFGGFKALPL